MIFLKLKFCISIFKTKCFVTCFEAIVCCVNSFDFVLFFNLCSSPHALHNHNLVKISKSKMAHSLFFFTRWVYKTILCNTLNSNEIKHLTKQWYWCDIRNFLCTVKFTEINSPTSVCSTYETERDDLEI